MGRVFTTTVGVPHRDCFSPVLFTIYLAKALRGEITDHTYARPITYNEMIAPHIIDHAYSHPSKDQPVLIDQQYADDVGWISTSKYKTNRLKKETPQKLKKRNLQINGTKTEEFDIERGGD